MAFCSFLANNGIFRYLLVPIGVPKRILLIKIDHLDLNLKGICSKIDFFSLFKTPRRYVLTKTCFFGSLIAILLQIPFKLTPQWGPKGLFLAIF